MCDNCCSGKVTSITYSECVFIALGLACNVAAPLCRLWPVRLHVVFPYYLIIGTIFEKQVIEHNMCVLICSTTFA